MPISLPGYPQPAVTPGTPTRMIGTVALDDQVNCFISDITIPSARDLQLDRLISRWGRVSRTREDALPLVIDVKGLYVDAGGKFFRDWKAQLLTMSRAPFVLGDGTRFEMVDVTEVTSTLSAGGPVGPVPGQVRAWALKVASYEPFAREVTPFLQTASNLPLTAGTSTTTFSLSCQGSAFSEPTWQFAFGLPAGVAVTMIQLQNTASGEICTVRPSQIVGGNWYVLMDASGADAPVTGTPRTPNNNGYGLLGGPSAGYGCTAVPQGQPGTDIDFTGRVPRLVPSPSPGLPPSAYPNQIIASVTASAPMASAVLQVLAPSRWIR